MIHRGIDHLVDGVQQTGDVLKFQGVKGLKQRMMQTRLSHVHINNNNNIIRIVT